MRRGLCACAACRLCRFKPLLQALLAVRTVLKDSTPLLFKVYASSNVRSGILVLDSMGYWGVGPP